MSDLCIYTHNSRLFYLLTKKLRAEHIQFTALDSYDDLHPSAQVLLTTQLDLDRFDPEIPYFVDILIILPHQSPEEIMYLTLQHMNNLHHAKDITIAIDPGSEKSGLAILLNDVYLYSKEIFQIKDLIHDVLTIFNTFANLRKIIKIGNGYSRLTRKFLNCFFKHPLLGEDIQYFLINEVKTSKIRWRGKKKFKSVHERAAMLIGKRSGELITAESFF